MALPGEVNEWWRARNAMRLVQHQGTWRIQGPGCERARIAYAHLDGDGVRFSLEASAVAHYKPDTKLIRTVLQKSES